jgi:D-glycero-alpha-D-manno-heptose-7-phosphate kinase
VIIVRSPLRITLGGGGTDLPSYYRQHCGSLIAATIDKYVYVSVMQPFRDGIYLKYSDIEHVDQIKDVQHPIVRAALGLLMPEPCNVELVSLADVPAGTGLGSSGTFTVALVKALSAFQRKHITAEAAAKMACKIEIDLLATAVGKQDQYAAAYGGISKYEFHSDESVHVRPLGLSSQTLHDLEDRLALFFTGYVHSASEILKDQNVRTQTGDASMIENLHRVKQLGVATATALEAGRTEEFGEILHEQWGFKKSRVAGASNPQIDEWYELARKNGATGGKLVGAGAGGFLLCYAKDRRKLAVAMEAAGLKELRFRFDFDGARTVMQ